MPTSTVSRLPTPDAKVASNNDTGVTPGAIKIAPLPTRKDVGVPVVSRTSLIWKNGTFLLDGKHFQARSLDLILIG